MAYNSFKMFCLIILLNTLEKLINPQKSHWQKISIPIYYVKFCLLLLIRGFKTMFSGALFTQLIHLE